MIFKNNVVLGDSCAVLRNIEPSSISACITDPPYNYEFIGHKWDSGEIDRRMNRVSSVDSKTLVKNIPYGSHLAGGVRDKRWYQRIQENINSYQDWCFSWAAPLFEACCPGAPVAVFNSTRTVAHVQIALERAGFYARDILVYRRHSGIPKGLNMSAKLRKKNDPSADDWEGWHSCFRNEWEAVALVQKPLDRNYETTVEKYGVGLFRTINDDASFSSNIIEGISNRRGKNENLHVNEKPLALMQRLVELLVPKNPDNIVLDPFCGSGTTLLAAKMHGVSYTGIDIDPKCIEISNERLAGPSDLLSFDNKAATKRIEEPVQIKFG
ncbi:DNA methyltransferase [Pararhizobium sp. YC-54]|uniref:DNA-methyltransferase n=1 Tax=Pararhizobium sp. YC-54 TaxID=2986920 RepID=UPI0021F72365|nr:DNA methyltransferase [Pararhizobium sp. YC-54]MCV9997965.1 DNA methyltransferase [Pararhizobium sp. YC-54]